MIEIFSRLPLWYGMIARGFAYTRTQRALFTYSDYYMNKLLDYLPNRIASIGGGHHDRGPTLSVLSSSGSSTAAKMSVMVGRKEGREASWLRRTLIRSKASAV